MRATPNRPISDEEAACVRVALERGPTVSNAATLLPTIEDLRVTGVCECGCASVVFGEAIEEPAQPFADAIGKTGRGGDVGVIVWGFGNAITGLEVYDLGAGDDDLNLPNLNSIGPWNKKKTLLVKPTSVRILAWICIVFFFFCATMSWRVGLGRLSPAAQASIVILFLIFVLLGIYLLLSSGSVEMDEEAITYRTYLAQFRIAWSEVKHIEIDRQGSNIVFCGDNKRLAALGPMFWSGSDKKPMLRLLDTQVRKGGIEIRQTAKAQYRLSRNTKVSIVK